MSDMRRLIESMDKISEAGPKGLQRPGLELGPEMGGGGAGGGARLPTLTNVVKPAPPAVWRNPRTGQTTTAPGTTVSQPLPPGVTPSTAGAGRGTTPVTQPATSGKDATSSTTGTYGGGRVGGTAVPGAAKELPNTSQQYKMPEIFKSLDKLFPGAKINPNPPPTAVQTPGAQAFSTMQKQLTTPDPSAQAAQAFNTMQKQLATGKAGNAPQGPKETTPSDLQKLANIPTSRTAEPGGRIEPKFDMDEEKIVPGTKFPGYWKGRDSAAKSRDRMVGDESIIKELHNTTTSAEFKLQEQYDQFKKDFGQISPSIADLPKAEVNKQISSVGPSIANLPKAEVNRQISSKAQNPAYTGIDPIVRQRQGMPLATQGEIQSYLDRNPPGIKTGDGSAVTSGSGAPIQSGGLVNVAKAADAASPDRALSVAKPPAKPLDIRNRNDGTLPPLPAAAPAPAPAAAAPVSPAAVPTPVKPATASTSAPLPPAAAPAAAPVKPATAAPVPYKGSAGSQEIQKLNPAIKDVNKIQVGQTFKMPDGSNYTVKPGDTLDKIARGSNKPDQLSVPPKQLQQITDQPKSAPVKPAMPSAVQPQTRSPIKPPADPTAGDAKDAAAQAAADRIDPGAPGFVPPSKTAPPNKPGVATSGPLKGINTTPLTRAEKERIDANDRAAAQKNEAINKLAEQFAAFMEAQDEYGPEYQAMVKRVGDRARQGAMKTVWDPVKRVYKNVPVKQTKSVKEYENAQDQDSQVTSPPAPAATAASQTFVQDKELQNMNAQKTLEADAGAQDPNKQTTSPPSPAAVAKPVAPAAPDVSVATAKTTMAGLKPALGPGVDTNAAATGVAKANLGQQLNPAEQQAVSAITPLVMKAATIPSAAPQLRSALTNAGTMARAAAAQQGKM